MLCILRINLINIKCYLTVRDHVCLDIAYIHNNVQLVAPISFFLFLMNYKYKKYKVNGFCMDSYDILHSKNAEMFQPMVGSNMDIVRVNLSQRWVCPYFTHLCVKKSSIF